MQIGHTGFELAERNLNFNNGNASYKILTLGTGSYVVSANLDISSANNHILIGNYSSIAGGIHFSVAANHDYKKVTTYTLDYPDIFINFQKLYPDIAGQQGGGVKEKFFTDRNKANSHQIIIGNDVWIGVNATIMSGVKIGNGAVIGAHAVVAKDIPPYAVAVGNPVRVIKYRFDEETIKKFMAIKWWNWDTKKIFQNMEMFLYVDEFLKKYYSPELEKIPEDKMSADLPLEKYIAEGRKIFSFIADSSAQHSLWRRVVNGFYKSKLKNAVLIFGIGEGFTQGDIENLEKMILANKSSTEKIVHLIPLQNSKILSPYLLRNSTHFIATREMISLQCMDWLWDTGVKVVSAMDDAIFEGEPPVDWNEIYA